MPQQVLLDGCFPPIVFKINRDQSQCSYVWFKEQNKSRCEQSDPDEAFTQTSRFESPIALSLDVGWDEDCSLDAVR